MEQQEFWVIRLFKGLKRLMTGEKLRTVDVMIHDGATKMSWTLKRETKSAELYVVLANLSTANKQYSIFEPEQFEQFADAVHEIQASLRHHESSEARF